MKWLFDDSSCYLHMKQLFDDSSCYVHMKWLFDDCTYVRTHEFIWWFQFYMFTTLKNYAVDGTQEIVIKENQITSHYVYQTSLYG